MESQGGTESENDKGRPSPCLSRTDLKLVKCFSRALWNVCGGRINLVCWGLSHVLSRTTQTQLLVGETEDSNATTQQQYRVAWRTIHYYRLSHTNHAPDPDLITTEVTLEGTCVRYTWTLDLTLPCGPNGLLSRVLRERDERGRCCCGQIRRMLCGE